MQECTIEMVVGTLDLKTVSLRHDLLWLKQAKDMTLFRITHQELFFTNASNPEQGLRMLIVLKRKIMSEIMTTFFPSILLTLITFATTLFKQVRIYNLNLEFGVRALQSYFFRFILKLL